MSELKPFQKATVKVVLKAFSRKTSTHRFLIADEVGLGKTLVAGEIIRRMAKSSSKPLVVLYVCSNLSIASQNKRKLLEWLPEHERKIAVSPVDRLTLLPEHSFQDHSQVHLYTLTPDTSIPMREGRHSAGRKEERALIHALVKKIWPDFFAGRSHGYFRGNVGSKVWRELIKSKRAFVSDRKNSGLREMFRNSLRKELRLAEGMHVVPGLNLIENENNDKGRLKIIALFRNALAAGAIEQLQPDLVIFDEFQRFRDLLAEDIDESAARVIESLRGDDAGNSLKLLLLSATPYRPYTKKWEDEQDRSHRKEFFELLEFLYRRNSKAKRISKMCAQNLLVMEEELRKGNLGTARYDEALTTMENSMRAVICRTERASFPKECLDLKPISVSTNLNKPDLKIFKHMTKSIHDKHRPSATPYWSSIPLPMQTMGPGYQTWKAAKEVKDRSVPSLSKGQRENFKKLLDPAHPRLRALKGIMPIERLALPWIAPSAPWWPLKGPWKHGNGDGGKVLIFSRFQAVPQAIASLMSYDLETNLLASDTIVYDELTKRRSLQPKAGNEALLGHFYPSVFLIKNTDPIGNGIGSLALAKKTVERQLRSALRTMGISIRERNKKRPTWCLLAALERKQLGSLDAVDTILKSWSALHVSEMSESRDGSETGFKKMLKVWKGAAAAEISDITTAEFKDLVRYALSAPGVVVGRTLARHWSAALKGDGLVKCIEISWKGLRSYLSSRLFVKALAGSERRYPEAIRKAALEGNLESVLDEHLWIISKLTGAKDADLADELLEALRIRTSNFFMHSLGYKSKKRRFSLRCHVAMPFTDPRADKSSLHLYGDGDKPIRTDELRKAFNSPFWPHILATTSVGQEGLDFHVWCESLLHWDLCNSPVDLEQREGRIRRYGGFAIRRKLSQLLWNKEMRIVALTSPWAKLAKIAEKECADPDDGGLSPWWVCEGADIKRLIIDLPASEQKHRFEILKRQRLLYRLTLGQPNQEDLLDTISDKYSGNNNIAKIGLNLSAYFRHKKDI